MSIQQRLNYNWKNIETEPSLALSQQKALETSEEILAILFQEYAIERDFLEMAKKHFIQKSEKNVIDFSFKKKSVMLPFGKGRATKSLIFS